MINLLFVLITDSIRTHTHTQTNLQPYKCGIPLHITIHIIIRTDTEHGLRLAIPKRDRDIEPSYSIFTYQFYYMRIMKMMLLDAAAIDKQQHRWMYSNGCQEFLN